MIVVLAEIEHLREGVGDRVERALAKALSAEPVVLDKAENRALVCDRVVNEVRPRPL